MQWSSDTVVLGLEVATNTECKMLAALSVVITIWALGGVVTETLIKLTRVSHVMLQSTELPACTALPTPRAFPACNPLLPHLGMPEPLLYTSPSSALPSLQDPNEVLLDENARYFKTSLSIACLLLTILLGMLGTFTWRLWDARRSGRHWSPRRRRVALLSYAQLLVQTLNTALWLAQCAYLVGLTSELNSYLVVLLGWGQWTLWNCEFLLIVVQGHGGNVWRGNRFTNSSLCGAKAAEASQTSGAVQPEKLVLDAPM